MASDTPRVDVVRPAPFGPSSCVCRTSSRSSLSVGQHHILIIIPHIILLLLLRVSDGIPARNCNDYVSRGSRKKQIYESSRYDAVYMWTKGSGKMSSQIQTNFSKSVTALAHSPVGFGPALPFKSQGRGVRHGSRAVTHAGWRRGAKEATHSRVRPGRRRDPSHPRRARGVGALRAFDAQMHV